MSFAIPPYPFDRLEPILATADRHDGGRIDCSIGTPCDAPPSLVLDALAAATSHRGYPKSVGSATYRAAISAYLLRRYAVQVPESAIAACVGTKEFVASLPSYLRLRDESRDTVLYPATSYPTYEMGARVASLRAVAVPVVDGALDLDAISADDAARALCLWVNSPSNPTGRVEDLSRVASWGRHHGVLVASDECYSEFTWTGSPRSILQEGSEGVLAVHSISKRSNLAGVRAGFYAGDAQVVSFLALARQHAGLMVAGPVQDAVAVAYGDDAHVDAQRARYHERLDLMSAALRDVGFSVDPCEGAFYLWVTEGRDGFDTAQRLAEASGLVVSPGEFYGERSDTYVRVAMVQPTARLEIVAQRLRESSLNR